MITYNMIKEAQEDIATNWGEEVVMECRKFAPLDMTCDEFLKHCTACGGNWGGMLLTGVKALRPSVWDVIPEQMGRNAWLHICNVLTLLGVDTGDE